MRIQGINISLKQIIFLIVYYSFLRYLPSGTSFFGGKICRKLRYHCCKHIFKTCGNNVNIERLAVFGSGIDIEIGNNSGIGINCVVPSDTVIGENVMMGPNCYILSANHEFKNREIPMINQGHAIRKKTIIADDVWIGRDVIFTPGRTVQKGCIIAAGCVLTKDFPAYCIIGGNPSRVIKER